MAQEDLERTICGECVGDTYMSVQIDKSGAEATCEFCNKDTACMTLGELADHVEAAISLHYRLTSDQPDGFEHAMLADKESGYVWERSGYPLADLLNDMLSLPEAAAEAVLDILADEHFDWDDAKAGEENPFDRDAHYAPVRVSDMDLQYGWQEIEASLKSRSRFFNQEAQVFLDSIFAGIDARTTLDGKPILVRAGPGTDIEGFYRARAFENDQDLETAMGRPDLHLGPPPAHLARAGRMNAHGVSVFYGAENETVAIAEIRPPVGSRALTGRFTLTKNVLLLDLAALAEMYVDGSQLDPNYAEQLARARFLGRLIDQMTLPVTPTVETTEYLVTQMIADYLSQASGLEIDGILFPSVQHRDDPARNVVLFHDASRVEAADLPEGTEIEAGTYQRSEDPDDIEYHVSEYLPDNPPPPVEPLRFPHNLSWAMSPLLYDPTADNREPTLAVDSQSLGVHSIERIEIRATRYEVGHFRGPRYKPPAF